MSAINDLKKKKLLIFGTGAIGGYYGGMLVRAGFDVTFIARGKNYEVLKNKGLTLIRDKEKGVIPVNVFSETKNLGYFDYIFVCVKSMDTEVAATQIKNNIGPVASVVSFQNGIENEDIIASVVGIEKVVGALVFVASRQIEPGVIHQYGYNGGLVGELDKRKTNRLLELQDMFQYSGVDIKISEDIIADFWNKLVWNASFNPISVLTGKTVDKILKEDADLLKNVMAEVRDIALACGVNIRKDTVEFNLNRSKGFHGFKTSTLQDFERGKPIELEALVGVVIRKAKEKNISVPNIEKVYNQLKQMLSVKA